MKESALSLKNGANLWAQLDIVTWDIFIFDVVFRKCEIDHDEVLFKKYSVNVVRIICNENRIPFIKSDPVNF